MSESVLLVDDEPAVSRSLSRLLRKDKYEIFIANNAQEALQLLSQHSVNIVVSDQRMPVMSGSELLTEIKKRYPDIIGIIISGYSDFNAVREGINHGEIYKFLSKPWKAELFLAEIKSAVRIQALRLRNKQLACLFERTIEAIILTDEWGRIESVNPAFQKLTGFSFDQVRKRSVAGLFSEKTETQNSSYPLNFKNNVRISEWHGELTCIKNTGQRMPVWLNFMPVDGDKINSKYIVLFIDISHQKKTEQRIKYLALHDELTELPNRRLFHDHLKLAIHQCKRIERNMAVLFIDLDRFKNINDTLGHQAGDWLLKKVAKRLSKVVRKGETLARFGGDEFVVLLPVVDSHLACEKVAEKLILTLRKPFVYLQCKLHISPSIGISTLRTNHNFQEPDPVRLIRQADSAMYRAKEKGGNNFQFYDPLNANQQARQLKVENGLHDALKRNEFIAFYQPQLSVSSNCVTGCEALVRWQHPQNGIMPPSEFIDIAEQTDLIIPIGMNVLSIACKQLSQWRYANQCSCNVAVNLSARQFNEPDLIKQIESVISRYKINPQWLEIEITENTLLADMDNSISVLRQLGRIGVNIALDDFGTGYSSLSYLKKLPINTLKIDRSFIRELPDDKKSRVIISSILKMAKALGLSIVAEGVENKRQFDFLADNHCDLVQGYYVSPPLENKNILALFSNINKEKD